MRGRVEARILLAVNSDLEQSGGTDPAAGNRNVGYFTPKDFADKFIEKLVIRKYVANYS